MVLISISRALAGIAVAGLTNFMAFMAFMLAVYQRLDLVFLSFTGVNALAGTFALIVAFTTKRPSMLTGLQMILCGLVIFASGYFYFYPICYAGGGIILAGVLYTIGAKFVKPGRRFIYL